MWTLKKNQPAFEMVDGPMVGRKFCHGEKYTDIPQNEANRFERVQAAKAKKKEVADAE